jgi:hypothetical protein
MPMRHDPSKETYSGQISASDRMWGSAAQRAINITGRLNCGFSPIVSLAPIGSWCPFVAGCGRTKYIYKSDDSEISPKIK